MRARTGKTYTQYQVDKLLEMAEKDYEKQWNEQVEEIRTKTFENVKVDMYAQFMSIAMATLEKFHGFTEEQSAEFYNNCISLMNIMNSKPLGKDFTTQDTINHIKENTGIDIDEGIRNLTENETKIYTEQLENNAVDTGIEL